ncbi:MAG: cyclic nucleotide-binding domain-containing protein [Bacteroidota bacterium]
MANFYPRIHGPLQLKEWAGAAALNQMAVQNTSPLAGIRLKLIRATANCNLHSQHLKNIHEEAVPSYRTVFITRHFKNLILILKLRLKWLTMNGLRAEIERLSGGTEVEIETIYKNLTLHSLKKGRFLLRQGHFCNQYFFMEKGAVRLYYLKNDKDFTVWMGTEGQIFTELDSYLNGTPALVSIETVGDSLIYSIGKNKSDTLAFNFQPYNTLLRRTVEEGFASMSRNLISFQSDDAAERYSRVEKEKNWLEKYPLKYISSFIGVTQSSLSRVRANKNR